VSVVGGGGADSEQVDIKVVTGVPLRLGGDSQLGGHLGRVVYLSQWQQ